MIANQVASKDTKLNMWLKDIFVDGKTMTVSSKRPGCEVEYSHTTVNVKMNALLIPTPIATSVRGWIRTIMYDLLKETERQPVKVRFRQIEGPKYQVSNE